MATQPEAPLDHLALADPDLAESVAAALAPKESEVSPSEVDLLVRETLWGLSVEISFGKAVAEGYMSLLGEVGSARVSRYQRAIHRAGDKGPTLGRLMATHLPPVLKVGRQALTDRFFQTVEVVLARGMHLLDEPLKCLTHLLSAGEADAGSAFLDLLSVVFSRDLTYNRARALAHLLPTAVIRLSPAKRSWQTRELHRTASVATELVDPFLAGIEKGLYLLSKDALVQFVTKGINKYQTNRGAGQAFLALDSQLAIQALNALQVSVPISQIKRPLDRYLRARTGVGLAIRPLAALPTSVFEPGPAPMVCSDGQFIYLPDEISIFDTQAQNQALYKLLAKLEAGYHEFGTYLFDLDKLMVRCPEWQPAGGISDAVSDLERFALSFALPGLAMDLFTIFENGRLRGLMNTRYPGLVRQAVPMLAAEIQRQPGLMPEPGRALVAEVMLGTGSADTCGIIDRAAGDIRLISRRFETLIQADPRVETCGQLVVTCYPEIAKSMASLPTPFGRRVRPDLVRRRHPEAERLAGQVKAYLDKQEIRIYRSDLREHLVEHKGRLSSDDLVCLIEKREPSPDALPPLADLATTLKEILSQMDGQLDTAPPQPETAGPVFWYPEWDNQATDYMSEHVRIVEREIPRVSHRAYQEILNTHQRLVKKIRYAFELLKPEGLAILRHWTEGDEFDYRALIDAAIDRKMGRIPSDRLYIKRLKQQRDVAVMLLVDLSRSTANTVGNTKKTILDVEREAIVLFCEALQVVGDTFAIAGFSGNGRLGVDYLRVKDFGDPMDEQVQGRICAMTPQRSTRMGGAIRHAASKLAGIPSKIRLLITLGDGFPNDTGYKGDYAVDDTRKAMAEARANGIYLRPITVNLARDQQLDSMYGSLQHNVISDVRDLPDKLWRIYSALTR